MNKLDTTTPHNYKYGTEKLEIHILGGLRVAKLDSLRVTMSIQKQKHENTRPDGYGQVIRHSIDLYNDNQVEKFTRTVAERLEIGTSTIRKDLQSLTKEIENHRFLLLSKEEQSK